MNLFAHFGRKKKEGPAIDTQRAIIRAVKAFLATETWDKAFHVLERERNLLLTEDADQYLADLLVEAEYQSQRLQGQDQMLRAEIHYLQINRQILRSVQNYPPSVIKEQCEQGIPNKSAYLLFPTQRACKNFINASWDDRASLLEEEQALLLTANADAFFTLLIYYESNPDAELCRILLRLAREKGIAHAWDEFNQLYPPAERSPVIPLIASVNVVIDSPPFIQIISALPQSTLEKNAGDHSVINPMTEQAIQALLCSYIWHEKRTLLEEKQNNLLTDDAEQQLQHFMERAREHAMTGLVKYLEIHYQLLKRARETSIPDAWNELEATYREAQMGPPKETAFHHPSLDPLFDELTSASSSGDNQRYIALVRELIHHVETGLGDELTWALLHYCLARALQIVDREEAIRYYHQALTIYTREMFPHIRAQVLVDLAILHSIRPEGSRIDNAEAALDCYFEALDLLPIFSPLMLSILNNIGLGFIERVKGDRLENLKQAIIYLNIRLYLSEPSSYSAALTKINLGRSHSGLAKLNAYPFKPESEEERAINYYREVLDVLTPDAFPQEYAGNLINLGNAYLDWHTGSPSENIEQAISYFKKALLVCTPSNFPREYANLQHNLAGAYAERIEGARSQNLQTALECIQRAIEAWPFEYYPQYFINSLIGKATLALTVIARDAEERGDDAAALRAYKIADEAFAVARHAQAELSWQEADEQGRGILQGNREVREMYANHAWCLWKIGDLKRAVVALENGRAQALTETVLIEQVSFEGICIEHTSAFIQAKTALQQARRKGDHSARRQARENFLAVRKAIQNCCKQDFLADEPAYQHIVQATAPDQALVYIAEARRGSLAFIIPPARDLSNPQERNPLAIPLPQLDSWKVYDWHVSKNADDTAVRGFHISVNDLGDKLVSGWNNGLGSERERKQFTFSLQNMPDALPDTMHTMRQALCALIQEKLHKVRTLSAGNLEQQQEAQHLWSQLTRPFDQTMLLKDFKYELSWHLQKAELDFLLPELSKFIMQPLREGLNALGLNSPAQPVALIPCGRFTSLPLHAAFVPHPHTGKHVPFQETCEFTYQPNARILSLAREKALKLPTKGPVIAIGNPRPGHQHNLCYAEQEALAIARQARLKERGSIKPLVANNANLKQTITILKQSKEQQDGSWITISGHGYADLADSHNCYMVLAYDKKLTLDMLRNEQWLSGTRCFAAMGCVTGKVDVHSAPDELISFAAGALQAGAASAIATLWGVSDSACFYLMLRFYRLVLDNPDKTPAWALREATAWLRTATQRDLAELRRINGIDKGDLFSCDDIHRVGINELPDTLRGLLLEEMPRDLPPQEDIATPLPSLSMTENEFPYAHPIHWAAAILYGA